MRRKPVEEKIGGMKHINKNVLGLSALTVGVLIVYFLLVKVYGLFNLPDLTTSMSYGLIFVIGLITGFHCVVMCGGFVLSYAAEDNFSHIIYGSGKIISYTIIGAIFGLLGSIIAFTPALRATIGLIAGFFLIIYGLNLLNIFPFLRRLQLRTPAFIAERIYTEQTKHASPFVIGIVNGLMIVCGPLQAMYVLAAGTGNALEGAKVMFIFGLGTLPLLLGLGVVASKIPANTTHRIMRYSGIIIVVLGIIMLNRGLILYGKGYDIESIASKIGLSNSGTSGIDQKRIENYQIIRMNVTRSGYEPNKFMLKKGMPVKWIINGKELNGCNNEIIVPKYMLDFRVIQGEQTIEFTPNNTGTVLWSCWMGMIRGSFIVYD